MGRGGDSEMERLREQGGRKRGVREERGDSEDRETQERGDREGNP